MGEKELFLTDTGPWRRRDNTDPWHFCRTCPDYPDAPGVETSNERPEKGAVCVTCGSIQAKGDCA